METAVGQSTVNSKPPVKPPPQSPPLSGKERAFSFPLSFQRGVNAVVTIYGEELKKRDLEVLEKKVKDLIDAWEDEEESPSGE